MARLRGAGRVVSYTYRTRKPRHHEDWPHDYQLKGEARYGGVLFDIEECACGLRRALNKRLERSEPPRLRSPGTERASIPRSVQLL